MNIEINETVIRKLLGVVDQGLVSGLGVPEPGKLCVEAAVCYSLGLPHGDALRVVAPSLRSLKIKLNDSRWSSVHARAKGLRRLAVIQLGSKGFLGEKEFAKRCAELAIKTCVPTALRAAASINKDPKHKQALLDAANRCEIEGTQQSALDARGAARAAHAAAYAAAYAAAAADAAADAHAAADAYDKILSDFAEGVVQILIDMDVPGCEWLPLTELAA